MADGYSVKRFTSTDVYSVKAVWLLLHNDISSDDQIGHSGSWECDVTLPEM